MVDKLAADSLALSQFCISLYIALCRINRHHRSSI